MTRDAPGSAARCAAHRSTSAACWVSSTSTKPPAAGDECASGAVERRTADAGASACGVEATSRGAVMLKLEVVTAELFVQDFPVIYGLLHTAVRELDALW